MSKKRRVVYAWEWGAGAGHLSTIAPMARHIATDPNFEIVLAVRDLTHVRQFFCNENFHVRQAPTLVGPQHNLTYNPCSFAGIAWNLGYNDGSRTHSLIDAWRGLLQEGVTGNPPL